MQDEFPMLGGKSNMNKSSCLNNLWQFFGGIRAKNLWHGFLGWCHTVDGSEILPTSWL